MKRKTGRPKKHPDEKRTAKIEARVTVSEREDAAHEARLHGTSLAEYARRRLGFGEPAVASRSTPSLITELEKRGIDAAELFSRDYIQEQAKAAGLSEAGLVRRMIEFSSAPPAKRQAAALVSEINHLGLQLKSVGVNANQLALATHTNRRFATSWEVVAARIDELRGRVSDVLERILEADD